MKLDEFIQMVIMDIKESIEEINENHPLLGDGHIDYPGKVEFSVFVTPDLEVMYEGWTNLRFTVEIIHDGIWK